MPFVIVVLLVVPLLEAVLNRRLGVPANQPEGPDPEFANLLCHHRWHVHHPITFERVHDLFAIASFDAFAIVPAEGYFDWGVGVESQNSIRHCCSPCASCGGGSNPSSGGSG